MAEWMNPESESEIEEHMALTEDRGRVCMARRARQAIHRSLRHLTDRASNHTKLANPYP